MAWLIKLFGKERHNFTVAGNYDNEETESTNLRVNHVLKTKKDKIIYYKIF